MKHEIAVVGDDGVVERQRADATPVTERPPLLRYRPRRLAVVGDLDVERQRAFGRRIAAIEDLRHDLVPEVEALSLDSRLVGRDEQSHELRRVRDLACGLAELGDLIQLPDRRGV